MLIFRRTPGQVFCFVYVFFQPVAGNQDGLTAAGTHKDLRYLRDLADPEEVPEGVPSGEVTRPVPDIHGSGNEPFTQVIGLPAARRVSAHGVAVIQNVGVTVAAALSGDGTTAVDTAAQSRVADHIQVAAGIVDRVAHGGHRVDTTRSRRTVGVDILGSDNNLDIQGSRVTGQQIGVLVDQAAQEFFRPLCLDIALPHGPHQAPAGSPVGAGVQALILLEPVVLDPDLRREPGGVFVEVNEPAGLLGEHGVETGIPFHIEPQGAGEAV